MSLETSPRSCGLASGNPFRDLLRIRATESGPGTATVVIDPLSPSLLQARGVVHGGVFSILVECAAGDGLRTVMRTDVDGATADLNVTYPRPVADSPLWACGRVVRSGRTVPVAVADICDGSDVPVATGGQPLRSAHGGGITLGSMTGWPAPTGSATLSWLSTRTIAHGGPSDEQ